jgi:hypothetical protein
MRVSARRLNAAVACCVASLVLGLICYAAAVLGAALAETLGQVALAFFYLVIVLTAVFVLMSGVVLFNSPAEFAWSLLRLLILLRSS